MIFVHVASWDAKSPTNMLINGSEIAFAVQASKDSSPDTALSFFPYQPRERRIVTFYPSFFEWRLGEMKTGICRHEVGHLLGFSHEHDSLSAGPDCPKDPNTAITTIGKVYDADSVMHYHCGANQNLLMKFTVQDRKAVVVIYGNPLR
jgi:hypothetical protein